MGQFPMKILLAIRYSHSAIPMAMGPYGPWTISHGPYAMAMA